MPDRHQPREEFVDRLEVTLRREAQRRNARTSTIRWVPRSRFRFAAGLTALVLVSMAAGGAAVAAAYQAQTNELRSLLVSNYERRLEIARQRLAAANDRMRALEHRVAIGTLAPEEALEARAGVVEAESQVRFVQLQLEEVRLTGREPLNEVSAPLVSGRDFVRERWLAELEAPTAALDLEKRRVQAIERRVAVGLADRQHVDIARSRVVELEAAIEAMRRKLDVRQQFTKGLIDAATAELLVLEGDAERRRRSLVPKVELAKRELVRVKGLFESGLVPSVHIAEADIKVRELETELAKADLDLALIRKQLADRRGK